MKDVQTLEKAARMALEALESIDGVGDVVRWNKQFEYFAKAITALRQALSNSVEQPAQQEPVAQWQKRHLHHWEGKWENTNEHDAKWWRDNAQGWEIRVLYTSPPASKPWVELDHDDIHALMNEFFYPGMQPYGAHFANFAKAIEAKLKEKNS